MSISETLEPARPTSHMSDPALSSAGDVDPSQGRISPPSRSERPSDYSSPNAASDAQQGELSSKIDGVGMSADPISDSSFMEQPNVKSEPEMLTPQYGSDMSGVGAGQVYNMQSLPSSAMQPPASRSGSSESGMGAQTALSSTSTSMSVPPSGSESSDAYVFRPPFVVDLDMVRRTMEGVNRILGVDLSEAEVSESALLDDPSREQTQLNDDLRTSNMGADQKDSVVVAKGEYSHMRLICDACGHIVAAVGRSVLEAAKESFEEGVKQGTPGMRPKPPVRKKRGGILGFKELASRANLSPWHFHRVFRVTTGVTPKTYGEALWEYLMLESGFNLDNEELTIDRNMGGKTNLSQAISSSSSSSPQSPNLSGVQHYSPNPPTRSPPMTSMAASASATGANGVGSQAMNQNIVPGTGRVRKARSRSRPSRSRSRTRSQTQSQVLTTLSAIGDAAAAEPVQRGRSFSRGIPPSVANVSSQAMLPNRPVSGSQGHPAPMPPPPPPPSHIPTAEPGTSTFDPDWFGPSDDLLGGAGHELNVPNMANQGLDIPDLTALSLQHLGLDQSVRPEAGDPIRGRQPNWQMPSTLNPMRSSSGMASSLPDMSVLNSTYGNSGSRLERFKSPETIANGEHNQHMDASFPVPGYPHPPHGIYDDSALVNGYAGGLNMNSYHHENDYSPAGSFHVQQLGVNQGPVGVRNNNMNTSGLAQYGAEASPVTASSGGLETQIHESINAGGGPSMHEDLQYNPSVQFHDSLHDNFTDNLQQEMYQQQHQHHTGEDIGALGDLPTSYYLGSKENSKYEDGSKAADDEFVSALIGDDPPMLASWNEADENPVNEYGF